MALSSGLRASGVAPALSPVGLHLALEQSGWYPSEFFLTAPSVVANQADIPCCVSCAISTCLEILNPTWEQLAPLFHFYMFNSSVQGGTVEHFEDMTITQGLNVLASRGLCLYRYYPVPFSEAGAKTPPNDTAMRDAFSRAMPYDNNREVGAFAGLSDNNRVSEWKTALLGNRPIIVGFYMTDQYGPKMDRLRGDPDPGRPHAVPILGYREVERSFLVQDSQGMEFAHGGQWWLPYDIAESTTVEQAYVVGYPPAR
jgi:hypothetical protein